MAICNLFKELTNTNGTFLTFSQYLEDITRQHTLTTRYRVVPSRFIALDLNPNTHNLNSSTIPKYIQNYFENACVCWKNKLGDDWNPSYSKDLFWHMFLSKFDTYTDYNSSLTIMKYIGDINIFSYDEVEGTGYSEIYCHIPNEATVEDIRVIPSGDRQIINSDEIGSYIKGYTDQELINAGLPAGWGSLEQGITYTLQTHNIEENKYESETPKSFNINTIIVLYDIYNDDEVLYSDIPMGIYFTGIVNTDVNGVKFISNSITKYITNEEIYGSGTSYGIRICSKYVTTAENTTVHEIGTKTGYQAEMTQLLSKMSESLDKMDQILDKTHINDQVYKDLLSIFKNNRTNTPYIKNIDGIDWWFINGRPVSRVIATISDYVDEDIINAMIDRKIQQYAAVVEHDYVTKESADEKYLSQSTAKSDYATNNSVTTQIDTFKTNVLEPEYPSNQEVEDDYVGFNDYIEGNDIDDMFESYI